MTVPTSLVSHPIVTTPLVARPIAPTDVSHPHIASYLEQANGSSYLSSTPLLSHSTRHMLRPHTRSSRVLSLPRTFHLHMSHRAPSRRAARLVQHLHPLLRVLWHILRLLDRCLLVESARVAVSCVAGRASTVSTLAFAHGLSSLFPSIWPRSTPISASFRTTVLRFP
jgi:hypothetical protein